MTLLLKPTGRGNVRGLTPKSEKRGKLRRQEKHDRGNTSLHQTKVDIIGNGRQSLPITRKVSERAGKISLERKKAGIECLD